MLLRKLTLAFFIVSCLSSFALAQNRIYLEYNNDCMTRLEYKVVSQAYKGNIVHYYASSSPSTKLVLETMKGGRKRLAARPNYLIPCHRVQYDESLMRKVNTGETDVYVVGRDKSGYWAHYVEFVSMMKDDGKNVSYHSFTYGFEYPNNNINPSTNLASNKSHNDVMFRGSTGLECMKFHTFRKTSKHTYDSHTDVTFSSRLGILRSAEIENSSVTTNSNKLISSMDLVNINNLPVDNYIDALCKNSKPRDPRLYIVPPSEVADEFSSRGGEVGTHQSGGIKTYPVFVAPKPAASDFTNGMTAVTEYGEPTAALKNYIAECDAYKKPGYHIVKPRESLYAISRMTGVTLVNLMNWNDISDKEMITACSELRLSPPTTDMYEALAEKKFESQKTVADKKALAEKAKVAKALAEKKASEAKVAKAKAMAELRARHLAELKAAKNNKTAEEKKSNEGADDLTSKGQVKNVNKKPSEELAALENIHIVKDGETLYAIARKYGFTSEKFMEINGLTSDIISPEMRLRTTDCACTLPDDYTPKGGITESYDAPTKIIKEISVVHRLKSGETLYQISKKYGVSVDRIVLLNDIKNPKDLSIGQDLKIK